MNLEEHNIINFSDFQKLCIQVGTIIKAEKFPEARKPAYKLWIDFGNEDVKKSSAQITSHYTPENLTGKQVLCVTNLKPRQIGSFMSEVLVTGLEDANEEIVLVVPEKKVPNGKILK